MKIALLKEQVKRFNCRIPLYCGGRYIKCWLDLIWSAARFGCSPNDYFHYEFHRKSNWEKNKFTTYRRSQGLIRKYNNPESVLKVLDKRVSNRFFADFISREWLDTSSCTCEDFGRFLSRHKEVIIKPAKGGSGKNIFKYSHSEEKDMERQFAETKDCLVEEIIKQHRLMRSLNPASVNAIRVITFFDGQDVNIIACYLKIGVGNTVIDNTGAGGLFAKIDTDTGIVISSCRDKHLQKYFIHPFSGVQVTGIRIPHWTLLLETVKKAALLVPGLKYLGWDFAILENGVEFIEANHDPGHIGQAVEQAGTYHIFKKCITNLKNNRRKASKTLSS